MSGSGSPPAPPGLKVLYAGAELIAVDKPAGLHTAPQGRAGEDTLLGRLLAAFPEIAALPGRKPGEPGLLHRLDRETSGIVVTARTAEAFRRLTRDFAAGRVAKEYLALCAPAVQLQPGRSFAVESRFAALGPGRRKVRMVPDGIPQARAGAGTAGLHRGRARRRASPESYRTEAVVEQARGDLALVRARILRGFRHQVRAHLSHLGLPIVGDELYGAPLPPGADRRLYLHACAVELPHPAGGATMRIEAPLPAAFVLCYGSKRGSE